MGVAKKNIFIDASIDKVYEYSGNMMKLSEWYANIIGPDDILGDNEEGTVVEMHYSLFGIKIPVVMSLIERTKNIWKAKLSGGTSGEQLMELKDKDGGTMVAITTTYTINNRILDKVANTSLVEKMVENALAHSLENLKMICEGL